MTGLFGFTPIDTYATNVLTRISKHTGGNCLVTSNFLSLQTTICSSTLCINSRGQCTYLHQSKDLMLIVYESLNQKLKLNPGCSKGRFLEILISIWFLKSMKSSKSSFFIFHLANIKIKKHDKIPLNISSLIQWKVAKREFSSFFYTQPCA